MGYIFPVHLLKYGELVPTQCITTVPGTMAMGENANETHTYVKHIRDTHKYVNSFPIHSIGSSSMDGAAGELQRESPPVDVIVGACVHVCMCAWIVVYGLFIPPSHRFHIHIQILSCVHSCISTFLHSFMLV